MANKFINDLADCPASFDFMPLSARVGYRLNVIDGVFQAEILKVIMGGIEMSQHLNIEALQGIQVIAQAHAVELFNSPRTRLMREE